MRRVALLAGRIASHYAASASSVASASKAASLVSCSGHAPILARLAVERAGWLQSRSFSSNIDVTKEVDAVNELFAAARDEIEYAKEEAETVYFNESVQEAKAAVEACLGRWEALLAALPEEERARVVRSMGLKIAQLQAEYDEVSKLHLED